MKVRLTVSLSVAAFAFAAITAAAQGPRDGMGPGMGQGMGGPGFGMHRPPMERALGLGEGRWWNNPTIIEKLKLTDEQRKSMDQILLDHRRDLVDRRGTLEKAELDLEPLLQEDQPNETKVLGQIDKVAQARAELEKANARFLLAIRAKLSPEQWKQLKDMRSERGARMGNMERRWREGRPGRPGPDGGKPQAPPPPPPPATGPGPQGMLDELPPFDIQNDALVTGTR